MTTASTPRRIAAVTTALAVIAGVLLQPTSAVAAEGPAPTPTQYRVIAGVHTDAVSTFLDDGRFTLGSKADVAEGTGTRFSAEDVRFHLEDAAEQIVPVGHEFIAPAGSTVWIATESNPGADRLWPGFSTESIPAGAIDGDDTTFTLAGFEGPGELEVFTGSGSTGPNRLWSSRDDSLRSFDMTRAHRHANWAFTASGTYRLEVEGSVSIGGARQTAAAAYTFVVGDLPEPTPTGTILSTSSSTLVSGDPLALTAHVTPADAEGFLEFRNGSAILGHEPVVDGRATLATPAPAVGTHALTATFVPAVADLSSGSTSDPVTVTVTDGSGVAFGVQGVASSYRPGDTLDARVVGHTPGSGEIYRWVWRQVGSTSSYVLTGGGQESSGRLTLPVDMSHDDYELSVQVREGRQTITQSPWVPIEVRSEIQPLTAVFPEEEMRLGDELIVKLRGTLAEGDSLRVAQRGTAGPWFPFTTFEHLDPNTLKLLPEWQSTGVSWTIQTVREGVVVAQSSPVAKDVRLREVLVEGVQGVYRVGQTLRATARVYPEIEGLTYTWSLDRSLPEAPYYESLVIREGGDEADLSVEIPIDVSHQGYTLVFTPALPDGHPSGATQVGSYRQPLTVSDSCPDTQLLFFETLSGHYHQGYNVNLNLIADPALADDDTIDWQWKWPGTDVWTQLPGASGTSHRLVAEQALDGVEVRAVLGFAAGGDGLTAAPVTILVDDHGSPARQNVTISGSAVQDGGLALTEGTSAAVSAEVEHGTVLETFQWFVQQPGDAEVSPIAGATSSTYEFTAARAQDGSRLTVAAMMPSGELAYGPSEPVTLSVEPADEEPPVSPTVTINGLEDSYRIGDTLTLTASQEPAAEADRWQWTIAPDGAASATVIPGQDTATLTRSLTASDDRASIRARLVDRNDELIAESDAVVITLNGVDEPGVEEPGANEPPIQDPGPGPGEGEGEGEGETTEPGAGTPGGPAAGGDVSNAGALAVTGSALSIVTASMVAILLALAGAALVLSRRRRTAIG